MKTVAIIQARLGSSRLPRKSLAQIHGRALILHVVDRVAAMSGLDAVVVAIPEHDDELYDALSKDHIPDHLIVRGPELDVLQRFAIAARQTDATTVVRVCGDSPLWCPTIGARVLKLYLETLGCDYAWNVKDGYVDGTDTEVFSRHVLERADAEATDPSDREHVTSYIRRMAIRQATLCPCGDFSWLKTSVDDASDLERVRLIAGKVSGYSLSETIRVADELRQHV